MSVPFLFASKEPKSSNNNTTYNNHKQLETTPLLAFELVRDDFGASNIDESSCRQLEENHGKQL